MRGRVRRHHQNAIVHCNTRPRLYYDGTMTRQFFKILSWLLVAAIVFVTISPIGLRPHTMTTVSLDRAAAFALVGFAFALAYPRRWFTLGLFLIAAAFGIELLQYVSPTRHPQFSDALVKAAGAIVGLAAGKIALALYRQRPVSVAESA